MELILLTNLAFSVVGFVFIFRMWREVKSRRDYYGEHFGIPYGQDRTREVAPAVNVPRRTPADCEAQVPSQMQEQGFSMEQLQQLVNAAVQQQQEQQKPKSNLDEGDLQQIIAAAVAAQNGGDS